MTPKDDPPSEPTALAHTLVGEMDRHLFNEGTHARLYETMGAHPGQVDGVAGCHFAVWAPNAREVSVVGDFNTWAPGRTALHPQGGSGIWAGFVPGVGHGDIYKYHIQSDHYAVAKADPLGACHETPPKTASRVWDLEYRWSDAAWMRDRKARAALDAPVSIYELHLGSWRRHPDGSFWTYDQLADPEHGLPAYLADLGFTHVEMMPVMQHPFGGSWGYHVTSYFAADARFGDPDGFRRLVDALHAAAPDVGGVTPVS